MHSQLPTEAPISSFRFNPSTAKSLRHGYDEVQSSYLISRDLDPDVREGLKKLSKKFFAAPVPFRDLYRTVSSALTRIANATLVFPFLSRSTLILLVSFILSELEEETVDIILRLLSRERIILYPSRVLLCTLGTFSKTRRVQNEAVIELRRTEGLSSGKRRGKYPKVHFTVETVVSKFSNA